MSKAQRLTLNRWGHVSIFNIRATLNAMFCKPFFFAILSGIDSDFNPANQQPLPRLVYAQSGVEICY
jgi:hypothetical protein